jgi:hypothetical protein
MRMSPEVREATLNGLKKVLGNKRFHVVLLEDPPSQSAHFFSTLDKRGSRQMLNWCKSIIRKYEKL